jgi:hypothetical protein
LPEADVGSSQVYFFVFAAISFTQVVTKPAQPLSRKLIISPFVYVPVLLLGNVCSKDEKKLLSLQRDNDLAKK